MDSHKIQRKYFTLAGWFILIVGGALINYLDRVLGWTIDGTPRIGSYVTLYFIFPAGIIFFSMA